MGFTPQDVKTMSYWEFVTVCKAYTRSQGGGETAKAPSIDKLNSQIAASKARDLAKLNASKS
ncbi:MAG: hypothetical protein COA43_11185 [Robiginitomaculum sp.]|nr:MAG: hypothetical protein COA43_11185 [Robiginitomaculum sp.]